MVGMLASVTRSWTSFFGTGVFREMAFSARIMNLVRSEALYPWIFGSAAEITASTSQTSLCHLESFPSGSRSIIVSCRTLLCTIFDEGHEWLTMRVAPPFVEVKQAPHYWAELLVGGQYNGGLRVRNKANSIFGRSQAMYTSAMMRLRILDAGPRSLVGSSNREWEYLTQ